MNIIFFESASDYTHMLPLTYTRPVADLRIGILKISEKWMKRLGRTSEISYLTAPHLSAAFPLRHGPENLYLSGTVCPSPALIERVSKLKNGEALAQNGQLIALCSREHFAAPEALFRFVEDRIQAENFTEKLTVLHRPWDITQGNPDEIRADFELVTAGRKSQKITDPHTAVYGEENLFVEEGVKVRAAVINAEDGPIYIGRGVEIGEQSTLRGPLALCEGTKTNIGSKIWGGSTFGPVSKVGGETAQVVFQGYSNKWHDGFMGHSVIGYWCNFGADTNTSNLKNSYSTIRVWDYETDDYIESEQQFFGLVGGDHIKCGINSMFNTGTVIGTAVNLYGDGFHPKFVPSFSWGGGRIGFDTFRFDKVLELARRVMKRRGLEPEPAEVEVLREAWRVSARFRYWETGFDEESGMRHKIVKTIPDTL